MRIGIDIDDTITNTYKKIVRAVSDSYNLDYNDLYNEHLDYYYMMKHDERFPDYAQKISVKLEHIVSTAPLKQNSCEIINKLSKEGNEIIFITARNHGEYSDPYNISKNYLDSHNIHNDKVIIESFDKGKTCIEEKIDLFIDDSVRNCLRVYECGIDTLLFDNVFNKQDKSLNRVSSWNEIYEIVHKKNNR